jgi:hypothetical protein
MAIRRDCEECERLHAMSAACLIEIQLARGALEVTPKNARDYSQRKQDLKKALGRLKNAQNQAFSHYSTHD